MKKNIVLVLMFVLIFITGCVQLNEDDRNSLTDALNKKYDLNNYTKDINNSYEHYHYHVGDGEESHTFIKSKNNELKKILQVNRITIFNNEMNEVQKGQLLKNLKEKISNSEKSMNQYEGIKYTYDFTDTSMVIIIDLDYDKIDVNKIENSEYYKNYPFDLTQYNKSYSNYIKLIEKQGFKKIK